MSKAKTGFFVAALAAAVAPRQAQSQADVDEVVVTAKHLEESLPRELARFGTRVATLTREEVRNGSYMDIAQSLQTLAPGLYMQPKNGPFDYCDISLLGSRTDDVLWLIDGVRINNRLYSGTPPLDTLPSSIVERIEVLEGGQALFYGTAAVAGAVNIVTKAFSDAPEGAVRLAAGTYESRHLDGYYSDGFGDHHVVLYGSIDRTDGFQAFRPQDYQPSATQRDRAYDVRTVGAKYAFDLADALRLSASYQHTDADLDFAQPFRVARDVNTRDEDLATVKVDWAPGERLGLYLKGYYHWWDTHYDTVYNDLATPGATTVLYDNAFWGYADRGVNALARFSFTKGIDYFVGYDVQRYGGRDEVLFIAPNKEQTQAVFAQVRITPEVLPKTHVAVGVRYNEPDVGRDATVWNVTANYDLSNTLFLRVAAGTNFRLPTAEELFADDPLDERGNPNLKPERSHSLNISIGGSLVREAAHWRWELIGFARDIQDLIDFDVFDEATQQVVFNNVPGTVRVRGGEALLEGSLSSAMSMNLSFTFSHSRHDGGDQISRVPEQLAKATLDYHPAAMPFGATLAINYTGDVFTTVGSQRFQYGNYAVVDLSGRYFLDSGHKHRLSLSLQNALNEEYGRPARGCADVASDGAFDCSAPYAFVNRGSPRILWAGYAYAF